MFWKKPPPISKRPHRFDPGRPLLYLSPQDAVTLETCYTNFSALGGIGSGKTSCMVQLALALASIGCGFVWACAKPGEVHLALRVAKAARRERDVMIFGRDPQKPDAPADDPMAEMTPLRFNASDFEARRGGTIAYVAYMAEMGRSLLRGRAEGGGENGAFWQQQFELLLSYAVDAAILADRPVSVQLLRDIQKSAPLNQQQLGSEAWKQNSVLMNCLRQAEARVDTGRVPERDLVRVMDYWLRDYFNLSEKTRSIIDVMFAALVDQYSRDPIHTLLSTETNFTPDDVMRGAFVILNLPTRTYFEPGRLAQFHFKYSFQRSVLARDARDPETVPVVLFCDEAHNFISDFDVQYFAESRQQKSIGCYLEQGIKGYENALGKHSASAVEAFLSSLQTKLFFQSSSPENNRFAAEVIGRGMTNRQGGSYSSNPQGAQAGGSWQEAMDYQVEPRAFSELMTGGHEHHQLVEAYVYKRGTRFHATGTNFLKATFKQMELTQ